MPRTLNLYTAPMMLMIMMMRSDDYVCVCVGWVARAPQRQQSRAKCFALAMAIYSFVFFKCAVLLWHDEEESLASLLVKCCSLIFVFICTLQNGKRSSGAHIILRRVSFICTEQTLTRRRGTPGIYTHVYSASVYTYTQIYDYSHMSRRPAHTLRRVQAASWERETTMALCRFLCLTAG